MAVCSDDRTLLEEGWLREGTELCAGRITVGPSGLVFEPRCRAGTRSKRKQRLSSPECTHAHVKRTYHARAGRHTARTHTRV